MRAALACVFAVLLSGVVFAQSSGQHLAIVIDCSAQSRRLFDRSIRHAMRAVERMTARDKVSVVVFDDAVELLVPATSVTNKATILAKIKGLKPKGKRALFAAIAKGADEVRRYASEEQVKRVMLLSGNGAGPLIGPGTPDEIRTLTKSLSKEKITLFSPQEGNAQGGRRATQPRRQSGKKEKGRQR